MKISKNHENHDKIMKITKNHENRGDFEKITKISVISVKIKKISFKSLKF